MMIDDDDIHAERFGLGERLDAGGAAIDGHQERRAALSQRAHRLDIRAVAFEQPVGNVDDRLATALPQETRQHGSGCGAIHIVVAEDRNALAARHGVGDARGCFRHGGEHIRIGHRAFDGRIEKGGDRVGLDMAAGEDARQQFGDLMTLCDRQRPRRAALVEPVAPGAPGRRILDAEEEAILSHGAIVTLSCSAKAGHPVNASIAEQLDLPRLLDHPLSRVMTSPIYSNLSSFRCSATMRRTVPLAERITTVSVSMRPWPNLTPRSMRPSVTPVAANKQSPRTMSSIKYFLRVSLMPILAARSRFSSVSITRRHCIWPPMQRSAAAASTPSGAPPVPR